MDPADQENVAQELKGLIDGSGGPGGASPYPRFQAWREQDPVHWHERLEAWLLTRYADAAPALKDRRLGSGYVDKLFELLSPEERQRATAMQESLRLWLLYRDAPDHTRVRGLLARAFTPRMVARLRPAMEETVAGLLDAVAPSGRMDVIWDLAYPLPIMMIADLLGAERGEREQFKEWADGLAKLLGHHRAGAAQVEEAFPIWSAMTEYFRGVVAARRRAPREDLISAMVAAEEEGARLSEEEILASCAALLYAGSETTTHLIGNGVLALLAHPDQRALLAADPALLRPAIEELLRYDAPTQAAGRIAVEDLELGGKRIRRGQGVIALLGSANRDPAQFADPDRLDLRRGENAHLSFSLGPHYCMGAAMARQEGEIALGALLRRFPRFALGTASPARDLKWIRNPTIRGVERLPLALG